MRQKEDDDESRALEDEDDDDDSSTISPQGAPLSRQTGTCKGQKTPPVPRTRPRKKLQEHFLFHTVTSLRGENDPTGLRGSQESQIVFSYDVLGYTSSILLKMIHQSPESFGTRNISQKLNVKIFAFSLNHWKDHKGFKSANVFSSV